MTGVRGRRPTIIDVAAAAGVSKSLVSLALRGDPGVSEATAARIRHAAAQLGYRSNALARALVQGRTMQVGVVVTDLANPYHVEVALGVETAATSHGFSTLMAHGRRDPDRLAAQLDAMVSLHVEGVVAVSSRIHPDALSDCADRVPLVVVGRLEVVPAGVDSVCNDDGGGATAAVAHLAGLGHRRVAYVSSSDRPAARARREGFAATAARLGLDHSPARIAPDAPAITAAVDELLGEGCTGVVCNNDLTAIAVMDHAHDLGVEVPGQLSVVGYDDTALAATVRPRLTSIDQSGTALGRTAMAMVSERIGGRTTARHEVLEPTLHIRASTAPPP